MLLQGSDFKHITWDTLLWHLFSFAYKHDSGSMFTLDSGIAKGFKQDSYLVALCEVIGRLIEVSTKRLLSDLIQRRSIWIAQIYHMAFCTTK